MVPDESEPRSQPLMTSQSHSSMRWDTFDPPRAIRTQKEIRLLICVETLKYKHAKLNQTSASLTEVLKTFFLGKRTSDLEVIPGPGQPNSSTCYWDNSCIPERRLASGIER